MSFYCINILCGTPGIVDADQNYASILYTVKPRYKDTRYKDILAIRIPPQDPNKI
jgi:hypothetical protein